MTLPELKTRQQAIIKTIAGPEPLRQRLVALGVLKGLNISVAATSLLGNPRVYSIGKQQICLRSKEASYIEVELQSNGG
ncbi:FeoA family protein [Amphritea sp. 1_MG-2023]|uniref:FeoA family protein n=1 Tax=Amphritea sp. 1_MG-2023 TaxID=3062670 RepID=UPI0026E2ECA7|nr:FeoA family protein [Amphritea sp. 1_MG-2023]MDO6563621.1 FeoA family protein [Amphritea sp. 1_MG-2023]